MGRLPEAINAYRTVVKMAPKNRDAWVDFAETLFEAEMLEEALEAYGKALTLRPDDAEAYVSQARAHFALGNSDESIYSLKMGIRIGSETERRLLTVLPRTVRRPANPPDVGPRPLI